MLRLSVTHTGARSTACRKFERLLNNSYLCAGNLLLHPEAGLLFIDFTTGDTLQLSGHAEVEWDNTHLPGAQRAVSFQTEAWVHVKGALPIQQNGPVENSPYNPTPPSAAQVSFLGCAEAPP